MNADARPVKVRLIQDGCGRERPREPEDEMNGGRSWRGAPRRPIVVGRSRVLVAAAAHPAPRVGSGSVAASRRQGAWRGCAVV